MLDLQPIKARRDKATPGPWNRNKWLNFSAATAGDCEFIANAPTDITALIEEVERVRAENEANVMARDAAIFKWKEALKLVEELEAKGSQLVESLDLVCMRYHESGELCWCRDACFVQGQSMADCRVANAAIKKWKEAQS